MWRGIDWSANYANSFQEMKPSRVPVSLKEGTIDNELFPLLTVKRQELYKYYRIHGALIRMLMYISNWQ